MPIYTPPLASNPYKFHVEKQNAGNTSGGAHAKVTFNTEIFDTNSNFDSSTNHRYTAPIAGFYLFYTSISVIAAPGSFFIASLYKNGSHYRRLTQQNNGAEQIIAGSILVEAAANDYFEIYVYATNTVALGVNSSYEVCYFGGYLVSQT